MKSVKIIPVIWDARKVVFELNLKPSEEYIKEELRKIPHLNDRLKISYSEDGKTLLELANDNTWIPPLYQSFEDRPGLEPPRLLISHDTDPGTYHFLVASFMTTGTSGLIYG